MSCCCSNELGMIYGMVIDIVLLLLLLLSWLSVAAGRGC